MTIIGIDLGTTNSTMSFIAKGKKDVQKFAIAQLSDNQEEKELFTLPSFYYFPLPEENKEPFVGLFARERGKELPERVISSAKSWLCHPYVDKRLPFLPLGDTIEIKKSPQEVCSSFLGHLRKTWEAKFPTVAFVDQKIFITVPASFDPASRQLVSESAEMIGCKNVILIEEPLAAFYAWLHRHETDWRKYLKIGDVALVVDIGGGTTDFSLISVEEKNGELVLERKAVGKHLLLGGDNIDLTLAYYLQNKLQEDFDFIQFQSLIHRCREAKEKLLGMDAQENYDIVLHGRGSRLIGGARTVNLTKEEIEKILVEGFFPHVHLNEVPQENSLSSLSELGLPYVKDPRITAHLAHFLARSGIKLPNKILFNGGTMKSVRFQERIISLLKEWSGDEVHLLEDADLDFAVSLGAAYYGWTKEHDAPRVRANTVRSYFIGVESSLPAVPGMTSPIKAICIAPAGMEEGSEKILESQKFSLFLEESAKFRFFSSDVAGIEVGKPFPLKELVELHPLETVLDKQGLEEKMVTVKLKVNVTEMGMLELWCVAEDGKKWKLEFDIRKEVTSQITSNN